MAADTGPSSSMSSLKTMTSTVQAVSEQDAPLLPSSSGLVGPHDDDVPANVQEPTPFLHKRVYRLCLIIFALAQAANYLLIPSLTQLKELSLCKAYYGRGWSLGRDCNVEPVQDALTGLIGWQELMDCAPGILLGLFYGIIADRYGRRPVLALALIGITVGVAWTQMILFWSDVFPVRLTWLSAAFSFVGGGSIVGNSMIFAMMSDVTTEEKRTTRFFRLAAIALFADMVLSPLGTALTQIQPWWPARLGLISLMMAILTVWIVLPETVDLNKKGSTKPEDVPQGTLLEEDEGGVLEEEDDPVVYVDDLKESFWKKVSERLISGLQDLRFVGAPRQLLVLVLVLLSSTLYRSTADFFSQYVSKRYGWRLSQASFLLTYRDVINLVSLTIILPGLSSFIIRRGRNARTKDLWLSRATAVCMTIGALIISISPSFSLMVIGLTFFAMGHGFVPIVLSLATSLVESGHIGILYNAMAVSETIGMLANGPILSSSFEAGMKVGGPLMGLPFLVAGLVLAMAATAVFAVQLPRRQTNHDDLDLLDEES